MPNTTGHFVFVSDTSKIGCGAALYHKQKGKYYLIAYYSKKLPEAVEWYSISELELTGVMANVAAFKHLLRNANFHVYCDHSALVHILKAKREPPTLRLKKLIENLSEYKFDIDFLKGKEMHISDFLSRHPDDEDSPNEIIPIAFMLRESEKPDFPENFLYLKEEVDALPEQENYEPYHENDFMFIFSNDSHENMSFLSGIYSTEYTRIETINVCTEEKKQLHDILTIMTRSMAKTKQADVPSIYPLKGEHKKPEHVKQIGIDKEVQEPNRNVPNVEEIPEPNQVDETDKVPLAVQDQLEIPVQKPPPLIQQRPEIYPTRIKRPNPLLEPSYNPKVMAKQLPKYEGLLNPQQIEIELRGRLPSYDVDKTIEKYPFSMDIPSIEVLNQKKRKLFNKIPEDTIFRRHIPKQVELDKLKALRAEYKRSPYRSSGI